MSAPAAWLADPTGRNQLRYWDGTLWTEHISNSGNQAVDGLGGVQPVAPVSTGASWMEKAKAKAQVAAAKANQAVDQASVVVAKQTKQWQQEYRASQSPTAGQGGGPVAPAAVAQPSTGQAPLPPGVGTPQPTVPAAPAAGQPDPAEQIRKLAALRDDGILTEAEFSAKKAKILGI